MNRFVLSVFLFFCIFSLSFFTYWEERSLEKNNEKSEFVPWELIIKYNEPVQSIPSTKRLLRSSSLENTNASFETLLEENDLELKEKSDTLDMALVEIKWEKSMDEVIESLKRNSNIEYVEPNYLRYFFSSNENLSTDDTHKG